MNSEEQRLKFLENRDGLPATHEFAQRTMKMYRQAILQSRKRGLRKPHHASLPEYRRGFIESYVTLKRYLRVK